MTPTRTRLGAVAAFTMLLLGPAVGACSSGDGSPSADGDSSPAARRRTFTVVLDWSPNTNHAGMYLAAAKGWYRDAGLDVRFVEPGDSSSLQLLAAGKADVAVSVQEEVVPARAEGLPVRSVAAIIQHNTSSLVSLASDGISGPKDLEGATYGGYGGDLENALVDRLVSCAGGDPEQVAKVDVGEADYRIGLERDQYDVVWIFDGWDGIRLRDIEGVDLASIPFAEHADCIPDWYTPLLATSERTEQRRPADLEAFLAATARGYRGAMADPEASAEALLDAAPDLDPALVRKSADHLATRYADDAASWGRQDPQVWNEFSAFLVDAGLIDEPIDVPAAWTNDYLPEAP